MRYCLLEPIGRCFATGDRSRSTGIYGTTDRRWELSRNRCRLFSDGGMFFWKMGSENWSGSLDMILHGSKKCFKKWNPTMVPTIILLEILEYWTWCCHVQCRVRTEQVIGCQTLCTCEKTVLSMKVVSILAPRQLNRCQSQNWWEIQKQKPRDDSKDTVSRWSVILKHSKMKRNQAITPAWIGSKNGSIFGESYMANCGAWFLQAQHKVNTMSTQRFAQSALCEGKTLGKSHI